MTRAMSSAPSVPDGMRYRLTYKLPQLRSTFLGLFIKSFVIILLGLLVFYIDDRDFFNYRYTIAFIIALAVLKCVYFLSISYHKILEVSVKNTAYYDFILFMAMNTTVVIISFSADFFCLLQVDPSSLKGLENNLSLFEKGFNCFYFSALNFSFFGYGDILPSSIPAKIIMLFETFLSFLAIILVLSDFISLKESIYERSKKINERKAAETTQR